MNKSLSVREIQLEDIDYIIQYWLKSDPDYLVSLGVDLTKLPSESGLRQMLLSQLNTPIENKLSYALIWQVDQQAVGHCNVNNIQFGHEAYMHLHLWQSTHRRKGMGTSLVKQSLPYFFNDLKLNQLICEPYALNPAPNKTLAKIGFEFEKEYTTIPGSLNFEQQVNRWKLSHSKFQQINQDSSDHA